MSEPVSVTDALKIAIRAEEAAKAAHQRLDRMNGSIDRLASAVEKVDGKSDKILLKLASEWGAVNARKGFIETRRFTVNALLAFGSLLVALVTVLVLAH